MVGRVPHRQERRQSPREEPGAGLPERPLPERGTVPPRPTGRPDREVLIATAPRTAYPGAPLPEKAAGHRKVAGTPGRSSRDGMDKRLISWAPLWHRVCQAIGHGG